MIKAPWALRATIAVITFVLIGAVVMFAGILFTYWTVGPNAAWGTVITVLFTGVYGCIMAATGALERWFLLDED